MLNFSVHLHVCSFILMIVSQFQMWCSVMYLSHMLCFCRVWWFWSVVFQADVEDEAAGVQAVCESPVVLRYEYHVVYSSSYQIPVLYFRVSTLGTQHSLSHCVSVIKPQRAAMFMCRLLSLCVFNNSSAFGLCALEKQTQHLHRMWVKIDVINTLMTSM